jgi:hypothetical protein
MTFTLLHLSAIMSIMIASFLTGVWYANNSYIRYRKTKDAMRVVDDFGRGLVKDLSETEFSKNRR